MKYRVAWSTAAVDDLACIWLASTDRDAVTACCEGIDRLPARSPETEGEELLDTVRTLFVNPLGVDFELVPDDMTVFILSDCTTDKDGGR